MDREIYYVYVINCLTPDYVYIGMTKHLEHRISKHKAGEGSAFTKRFGYKEHYVVGTFESKSEAKKYEGRMFHGLKKEGKKVCGSLWSVWDENKGEARQIYKH